MSSPKARNGSAGLRRAQSSIASPSHCTESFKELLLRDYDYFVLSCDSVMPAVFTACESFDQRHDQ
jgi:hypothetical protein